MADQSDFNKNALRKLAEQYLATTILQNEILGFLEENVSSKRSISNLLAERAGKSINTIYKNINELGIYNAISLLRYWQAMADICREFDIDETKIPNLNSLLMTYEEILSFINHITTEDQVEAVIENNFNAILKIITFYKSHGTSITPAEKKLLDQLEMHHLMNQALEEREQQRRKLILDRMKEK